MKSNKIVSLLLMIGTLCFGRMQAMSDLQVAYLATIATTSGLNLYEGYKSRKIAMNIEKNVLPYMYNASDLENALRDENATLLAGLHENSIKFYASIIPITALSAMAFHLDETYKTNSCLLVASVYSGLLLAGQCYNQRSLMQAKSIFSEKIKEEEKV